MLIYVSKCNILKSGQHQSILYRRKILTTTLREYSSNHKSHVSSIRKRNKIIGEDLGQHLLEEQFESERN